MTDCVTGSGNYSS